MSDVPQLALDANILGKIKESEIPLKKVVESDAEYYIPITQESEFTNDIERHRMENPDTAAAIDKVIQELEYIPVDIDSAPYEIVGYTRGPYGGGDSPHYDEIFDQLPDKSNESKDAIGIDAAINRGLTFVTDETKLQKAIKNCAPGHVLSTEEFVAFLNGDAEL